MDNETPLVRCPSCRSVLTGPLDETGMWEWRYHLCRAVFPIGVIQENGQVALICEKRCAYLCQRRESPGTRDEKRIRWR